MIRKAVGAIIKKGSEFLLVHKVKIMDGKQGPEIIESEWDFPKGGIKPDERDLEKAILRELKEETGSENYKILKELTDKICFTFPPEIQKKLGFEKQETTIFLVTYLGDGSDLNPEDEEIDEVKFFDKEEVMNKLEHKETREFFEEFVMQEIKG